MRTSQKILLLGLLFLIMNITVGFKLVSLGCEHVPTQILQQCLEEKAYYRNIFTGLGVVSSALILVGGALALRDMVRGSIEEFRRGLKGVQ